jgi:hypothetical protein
LKKNAFVEENAGIRENGINNFKFFDARNLSSLFAYLILPGGLFTLLVMDELKLKDEQMGRKQVYGLLPKCQ